MSWWTETPPRNRRLPLARRAPVRERQPSRVTLTPPRVAHAAGLTAEQQLVEPNTIVIASAPPARAACLPFSASPAQRGSVGLDRPSSEAEPVQPERGLAARGAASHERPRETTQEPPELSLAKRLSYLLQPPIESYLTSQGVVEWPHTLFDFQRDGIAALIGRDALLLADDMGLGKTVQTAAAMRILFRLRRIDAALLVVPASLILQWRRALREWAPELRTSTIRGAV